MAEGGRGQSAIQKALKELLDPQYVAPPAPPPWEEKPFKERVEVMISPLKSARENAAKQAGTFRDQVFGSWSRVFLQAVDDPSEWTQAKVLYANYVHLAGLRGAAKKDSIVARSVIASQTQWGKMMATKFIKDRRAKGYFYPVKLKPEAWGDPPK